MIEVIRTDARHQDFIDLVKCLDADLAIRDGADHAFYSQFNGLELIKHAVVIYEDDTPVGCGAIKQHGQNVLELKRMYTSPDKRGKGLAAKVLSELENWAIELGYHTIILETGKKQPEAIALYSKCGYQRIDNYGQYTGLENSLCFSKILSSQSS